MVKTIKNPTQPMELAKKHDTIMYKIARTNAQKISALYFSFVLSQKYPVKNDVKSGIDSDKLTSDIARAQITYFFFLYPFLDHTHNIKILESISTL